MPFCMREKKIKICIKYYDGIFSFFFQILPYANAQGLEQFRQYRCELRSLWTFPSGTNG